MVHLCGFKSLRVWLCYSSNRKLTYRLLEPPLPGTAKVDGPRTQAHISTSQMRKQRFGEVKYLAQGVTADPASNLKPSRPQNLCHSLCSKLWSRGPGGQASSKEFSPQEESSLPPRAAGGHGKPPSCLGFPLLLPEYPWIISKEQLPKGSPLWFPFRQG